MNIDEKIADLEKQLAEAKKQKESENGIWRPKSDDLFYYISECGDVASRYNESNIIVNGMMEYGNFYKTFAEAEYQANVQKYTNLFRKYVEEHSDKLDWEDTEQEKYSICYDCVENYYYHNNAWTQKQQGVIYASSEQILRDAVDFVGKENVIKYVLGVEND